MISIITIVLNDVEHIQETLKSVIQQGNVTKEYIVIDGGSSDGTVELINKYIDEIDYFISEPDKGIYHAINKGLSVAQYPLVGLIHSGDVYEPNVLNQVLNCFNDTNADLIYGDLKIKKEVDGKSIVTTNKASHLQLKKSMSIFHPASFIKLSAYKKMGLYNTEYRSAADYEFVLKLYLNNYKFVKIPLVLATFRTGGLSTSDIKLSFYENYKIRYNAFGFFSAASYLLFRMMKTLYYIFVKIIKHI